MRNRRGYLIKKHSASLVLCLAALFFVGTSTAGLIGQDGWEENDYFTLSVWEFNTDEQGKPDSKRYPCVNRYASPCHYLSSTHSSGP